MAKKERITDWVSHHNPNIVLIGTHNGTSDHFKKVQAFLTDRINTARHSVQYVGTSMFPPHLPDLGQRRSHKGDLNTIIHNAKKHHDKFLILLVGENVPNAAVRTLSNIERMLEYHKEFGMKLLVTMEPQFIGRKMFEERHKHLASVIGLYEEPKEFSEFALQLSKMDETEYRRYVSLELPDDTYVERPYLHGGGTVPVK